MRGTKFWACVELAVAVLSLALLFMHQISTPIAVALVATGFFLVMSGIDLRALIPQWVGFGALIAAGLLEFFGPAVLGIEASPWILYGGIALACVGAAITFPLK